MDASEVWYCGKRRDSCQCGTCDEFCGPADGCPCPDCRVLLSGVAGASQDGGSKQGNDTNLHEGCEGVLERGGGGGQSVQAVHAEGNECREWKGGGGSGVWRRDGGMERNALVQAPEFDNAFYGVSRHVPPSLGTPRATGSALQGGNGLDEIAGHSARHHRATDVIGGEGAAAAERVGALGREITSSPPEFLVLSLLPCLFARFLLLHSVC
jgi:hypothetical protein